MATNNPKQRFILVNIVPPILNHSAALYELEELESLVNTYGSADIVRIIQRRSHPDPATYIGQGKTREIAALIKTERIDVVVINDIIDSGRLFRLEKIFWVANPQIRVWDRVDLILKIFEKHATTSEARLQIELARMHHMGPRMYGLGGNPFSRQAGGIGTRGLGETNIELMKRHWRNQIRLTRKKIEKLVKEKESRLLLRRENNLLTVSLVGYTNSGKTSLFNLLTGKKKLTANILFATLDSVSGKIKHNNGQTNILVSDTIGFIRHLPPKLVEAFQSTLSESIHADLLLHVIDLSDIKFHEKIEVVENILRNLGLQNKKKIYVFNKVDLVKEIDRELINELYGQYNPVFISTKENQGINKLINSIDEQLHPNS